MKRLFSASLIGKQFVFLFIITVCLISACKVKDRSRENTADNEIDKDLIPEGANIIFCQNWQEFVSAVEKATPGDVIRLKSGTYSGNVKFSQSGSAASPVTIIPESRGEVMITGDSEWEFDGQYITVDGFYFLRGTSTRPVRFSKSSSHCRFINSAIVAWNLNGKDTRLVNISGSRNEVAHCVLRGKNTPGMMLEVLRDSDDRNDHHIHDVYFSYFKDPGAGNGFETVRIGTSGHSLSNSYTTLENCVFEQCDGELEIISNKSGHNTLRHNTFLNSNGSLTLRHGHDALVEGNFFINTLDRTSSRCNGIRVIGERQVVRNNYFLNLPQGAPAMQVQYGNQVPHKLTQYDQVKDALVENNTFYNCDTGVLLGFNKKPEDTPPRILPPNGIFRNNLIVSSKGMGLSLDIEPEILTKQLFTYGNNIVAGKAKIQPNAENLPDGIKFMETVEMTRHSNGLFYPVDSGITAGMLNEDANPLYPKDIVPAWVRVKMKNQDADLTGVPWQ